MAGWHHRLDGHEFGWTPGVGDGQGGLACSNSWGGKESDTTERLNWTELNWKLNIQKTKIMASGTQWTWVWVNSGSWWGTGKPSVLQSMGHKESDTTERLNWTELNNPRISDSGITYLTLRICYDSEALIASKKWKDFKLPDFSMVNFTSQSIYIFFLLCHSRQLTGGINLPDFRLYYKATVIKTV